MDTILTGLRTNGEFHLGNYLGAIQPMVNLVQQKGNDYKIQLFAPDLHSFTTPIDFGEPFYNQTLSNLKLFVAAGIPLDQPQVYIYRQSRIPAHSELTWILDNFTGFGELSRMVEFKEKSEQQESERVSVGLFNYPVLMAADILLYKAKWVPVGEDQRQHLEFTRTIAERFNNQFGPVFVVPAPISEQQQFINRDEAPRIRSLKNPTKKMSKSVDDPSGTILLSDDQHSIRRKIMSAETDGYAKIMLDWDNQPGISNLLTILALINDRSIADVVNEWQGRQKYGELKIAVADAVCAKIESLQTQINIVDESNLVTHLEQSEIVMNESAKDTLYAVQAAIGLR